MRKNIETIITTREHYTPAELAAKWGLHPETIRREIRRGRLKAFIVGGRKRIGVKEAAEYETQNSNNR